MKPTKGSAFGRGTYAHRNIVTAHLAAEGTSLQDRKPVCGKAAPGTRVTKDISQVDCGRCRNIEKGSRVRFDAKVEASKDDPTFGFFSRPTKAERIES